MTSFTEHPEQKILVISLSNIGDVIMTFPVIDALHRDAPNSQITVVCGPKAAPLLEGHPQLEVFPYEKKQPWRQKLRWVRRLRKERFDLAVDLRNSVTPFVIGARRVTSPFLFRRDGEHMRQQHMRRLRSVHKGAETPAPRFALQIPEDAKAAVAAMMKNQDIAKKKFVVLAPGAADAAKRWLAAHFARLSDYLGQRTPVVLVGGAGEDQAIAADISRQSNVPVINWSGGLTLLQLAEVMRHCSLTVVNDSAPMHLASYLEKPVLALFGPTDPRHYGPWSARARVIQAGQSEAQSEVTRNRLMQSISVDQVTEQLVWQRQCWTLKATSDVHSKAMESRTQHVTDGTA